MKRFLVSIAENGIHILLTCWLVAMWILLMFRS